MKSVKPWLLVTGIIGLLLLVRHCFFSGEQHLSPSKPTTAISANVSVYVAELENLGDKIFTSGTLISNESVNMQPEIQGKVTGIYFQEGQFISNGSLLVKLNDAELQANLHKTTAQFKLASEKTARFRKLLEISGLSKEDYDNALNVEESLEADIEIIKAKIAQTEIRAPFSGICGLKNISVGSVVSPSIVIATIEQSDPMKIDLSLPEKYSELLNAGSVFSFNVEGIDKTFMAKIYAKDPKIDIETRSVRLRAICPNPGKILKSGSFAKIVLQLHRKTNAILIPTQALIPDLNAIKIYLVKNGNAFPQLVKTGIRTQDRIEITEGLKAGDSIIVSGIMQVKPGMKHNIVK